MNGYESMSGNPFQQRGTNGSAHDVLNPSLFGSGGAFGGQQSGFGNVQQQNPWTTQQQFQQNPNQLWQQQLNPLLQQQLLQQLTQAQQGYGQMAGGWPQTQQQFGAFGPTNVQTAPMNTASVYTTKAVDIDVAIPAHAVLGKHPMEIQQYVLQVIVPTLLDALTKRAIAHDVGQSISFDIRGGCVTRVGI